MQAPKKDKAPPPSSKPAKSGGGKQKKKVIQIPCELLLVSIRLKRSLVLSFLDLCVGDVVRNCRSGARGSRRRR